MQTGPGVPCEAPPNAFCVVSSFTILVRSPFADLWTCPPDLVKTDMALSKFDISSDLTLTEWQIVSSDFLVALGPSFFIASFTNLLKKFRSRSRGMLSLASGLFFADRFQIRWWTVCGLKRGWIWNRMYKESKAYLLAAPPWCLPYSKKNFQQSLTWSLSPSEITSQNQGAPCDMTAYHLNKGTKKQ